MNILIESNIVMFNRRIHVPKYTVSNIISNSLIINVLYWKMCFVNWRFRSFVQYSIAIILMGKRELIAWLNLSSWCLVMVEQLFLAVPWGCLRFVIVVFPDYTHLLFFTVKNQIFIQSSTCSSRISNSDRVQGKKIHFETIQFEFSFFFVFFAMLLVHNI